ncbi:MAG: YSC84-related protein [Campylobacterota bacterium]|nr:YSC84-related protein [Campylobacterota bacterium]
MKSLKVFLAFLFVLALNTSLSAKSAVEIDQETNAAIGQFNKEVKGSAGFLSSAKGILVFPKVIKAGIGIGGEYGEGVLRVNGKSVQYYSTASASVGFQFGAQQKSVLIAFLTDEALAQFRKSDGWKVGVDGSVALVNVGAGKDISSATMNKPVVGFIYGSKGLMYNLTLEGSKFTKIVR